MAAAIPSVREATQSKSELQPQAVCELVLGELGAIQAIGHGGELHLGLLGPEHLAPDCRLDLCQKLVKDQHVGMLPVLLGLPVLPAGVACMEVGVQRRYSRRECTRRLVHAL